MPKEPPYKPPVPFKKRGLLFLPASLIEKPPLRPDSPLDNHIGALYIGFGDLFKIQGTLDRLHELASRMNWKNAAFALSRVSLVINNHGVLSPDIQEKLVDGLFSAETAKRIREVARSGRSPVFVFHRQQLLFLMKQVLMRSQDKAQPDERAEMELLLQGLLVTNDVLDHEFFGKMRQAGRPTTPNDEDVLIWGARNLLINSTEGLLHQFARHFQLYFELALSPEMRSSEDFVDLGQVFEEATGMPLVQFVAVGFAMMANYLKYEFTRDTSKESHFVVNERTHLATSKIGFPVVEKVLRMIARTPAQFRQDLQAEEAVAPDDTYSFVTFRRFPLLRLPEGFVLCISPQFLVERLTSGLYWTIFDHLKGRDEALLHKFTRFFGQLFEAYARNLCCRMLRNDPERVIPEFLYKYGKREARTSDVSIVYPRTLVLIEVVNTKINMVNTVAKGDFSSFERDTRNIVIDKAKQISRVIDDFKLGRFTLNGLTRKDFDRFIPVVVTSQSFPQHTFAWDYLKQALQKHKILQGRDIMPLSVLDAEELELAEGLVQAGSSFADLLMQRLRDAKHLELPFKNFVIAAYPDRGPNTEMAAIFDKYARELTSTLFSERPAQE